MSKPKIGDTVSFISYGGEVHGTVTGRVSWVSRCGIEVMVGDDCVTIDEEDIVPTPKSEKGL